MSFAIRNTGSTYPQEIIKNFIMKKVLLTVAVCFVAVAVFAQTMSKKDSIKMAKNMPEITFEKIVHDYGTVAYNGDGTCEFTFKNTGKNPLILTNAQASCGCTVPIWPKEPILKGKTAKIQVKYTTNRVGPINKTITITSNAKNSPVVLTIKGTVLPQETTATPNLEKDKTTAPTNNH